MLYKIALNVFRLRHWPSCNITLKKARSKLFLATLNQNEYFPHCPLLFPVVVMILRFPLSLSYEKQIPRGLTESQPLSGQKFQILNANPNPRGQIFKLLRSEFFFHFPFSLSCKKQIPRLLAKPQPLSGQKFKSNCKGKRKP